MSVLVNNSRKAKKHSEVMIKILLRIIERTPAGGATQDDLRETYRQVKKTEPHDRTLKRIINDLNAFFQEWEEEGDLCLPSRPIMALGSGKENTPAILSFRKNNTRRYIFTLEFCGGTQREDIQGAMLALSLYPQQKTLVDDQFQALMRMVGELAFSKRSKWLQLQEEMKQHIYVSDYSNSTAQQVGRRIVRALEAIRRRKRVQFDYVRNYDGTLTKARILECYGLVFRLGVWYLVGRDVSSWELRIFRLDQIQRLTIVENSVYEIPADFSLQKTFHNSWGGWTTDSEDQPETVRLLVQPGMAQKFVSTKYHDSQTVRMDEDGSAMVEFRVTGARQMLPWLMTWADTIEVDEPEWLKKALLENARSIVNMYSNSTLTVRPREKFIAEEIDEKSRL